MRFDHELKNNIAGIFPVPVYKKNINRELSQEEKNVLESILYDNVDNVNNKTGTDYFILENENLLELKKFIEAHINQYSYLAYSRSYSINLNITCSWLNLTEPGKSHHMHSHINSAISGVFYYKTVPSDAITFRRPYQHLMNFSFDPYKIPEYGSDELNFHVQDGDLVLFPSGLLHRVVENESNENRISLAFNTFPEGELGGNTTFLKI